MARAGSSPAIGTLKRLSQRENPAADLKFGWRTVTQKHAGKRNLFAKFVASASRARDSCDETRSVALLGLGLMGLAVARAKFRKA
jgi:hypothetical protein